VGWHFITPLATVQFGTPKSVDRVTLVGVDGHAEETGVGVNELNVVSLLEVMQDRSIIKVCQAGHILAFLILGGVDLRNLFFLEVFILASWQIDGHQISLGGLDFS